MAAPPPLPSSPPHTTTTTTSASCRTFRLSAVTAALNAMPSHPPSSLSGTPPLLPDPATSPSPFSKPSPIRLTNTQAHKDELLKKLLSKSESCTDLQMCLPQKPPPRPSASLPSSPVHTNGSPLPMHSSPVRTPVAQYSRKTFSEIMERGMQKKLEATKQPASIAAAADKLLELRKRKRGGALLVKNSPSITIHDAQDNISSPSTPAATPNLPGVQKDSLTRREIHIFSERQRRKGMTHLYTILHSLLPDAKPKSDRCTVLTEAMDYIRELQSRLNELGRQKSEILDAIGEQLRMESTTMSGQLMRGGAGHAELGRHSGISDDLITEEMKEEILAAAEVAVRYFGREAIITLNSPRRSGVWSAILHVLHEQEMDLLNVTLSTSNDMDYHCIHAKVLNSEFDSDELQKMLQIVVLNHAILD